MSKIAVHLQIEMFSISGKIYKRQRYICIDTKSFEDAGDNYFAYLDKETTESGSTVSKREFLHYVPY